MSVDPMENSDAPVFVDFANKYLQIHRIIPSLTQEEVLFSCCPECFVSMLICDKMEDNEIIMLQNIHRYSKYTGYLHSFRFESFHTDHSGFYSLAVDSVMSGHFGTESVFRDLGKILVGYEVSAKMMKQKGLPIKASTGNWGCGAFGGDHSLKFLQQICAAAMTGIRLDYSAFKNVELEKN